MSTELIAILVTMIGVGVALAGLMLTGLNNLRKEIQTQRAELQTHRAETQAEFKAVRAEMQAEFKAQREIIVSLLERVSHIEGLLEGLREVLTGRPVAAAEAAVAEDPGQYEQR